MKIFIAGATGVLGRRLVRRLTERGHAVVGLSRSERGDAVVRAHGGEPARASLFDADALARAAEGAEVVIHAATAIPTKPSRSTAAWAPNDRIRRDGTRALTAAAARIGARRYLQQSVVWVVRPADGAPYTEESTPNPAALVRSAVEGEEIAMEAGWKHGFGVGVLRCGGLYGADAAHTRMIAGMLRKRQLPSIGSGRFNIANLHADDAAGAFLAAAESEAVGIWHVVDDVPLPFAEFLRGFAQMLGAPAPRRIPIWLARLVLGRPVVDAMTSSMNTTNQKTRRELGWAPRYPTYREGLAQVIREWEADSSGAGVAAPALRT